MAKRNQYIVPDGNGWALKAEGAKKATKHFRTQQEAIQRGRKTSMNQKSELRIQNRQGKFRTAWSYGNDPYPPKG